MAVAIKVENLSKAYQLGEIGTGTLSRDIERWFAKVRGKEDPFLKIGETNDRTSKGTSDVVWSLKDINFEIQQGDAVGIIGRNGAGKSTLLKLLSRVTSPTTGNIKVKGRIASLLEVGTGFHPELTGKENIYLNGAILGMRKKEITRKFDEIVAFAGVERYIDTPVKRYSSGMYVRLAFAVAAHLDSEILIVDEVLAVGDAEFQKKCLGKMGEVSKGEGRTVLFVSHNMGMVAQLCNNAILLRSGTLSKNGSSDKIISEYVHSKASGNNLLQFEVNTKNTVCQILSASSINEKEEIVDSYFINQSILLNVKLIVKFFVPGLQIGVGLQDKFESRVSTLVKEIEDSKNNSSRNITLKLPANLIAPNTYSFVIAIWNKDGTVYDLKEGICPIRIIDNGSELALYEGNDYGSILLNGEWSIS